MTKTPEQILQQYWGYNKFRFPQLEIINTVLAKQDTLALLPTGGGKSLCFQLPTLLIDGLCLVITPLIALMHDQINQLKKRGISAIAIHSGMSRRALDITLDNCIYGNIKFLYLSPERLQTELFVERVKKMPVCLIAVDEAHCISEWGYDFRPAYRQIASLREKKPEATWIALTATATKVVKEDILVQLKLQNPCVFEKSFARENISFVVRHAAHQEQQLLDILQKVKGSSIIYARSRKSTEHLSRWLKQEGVSVTFYHAGLTSEERELRQKAWINDRIRVIIATSAFGMGIDKADVRTVIHTDMPETLEAYYQEAGRAGRDSQQSYSVLLYSEHDVKILRKKIESSHPTPTDLKTIYQALANYYGLAIGSAQGECFSWDLYDFCNRFQKNPALVQTLLKRLEEHGLIALHENFYKPSRVYFQGNKKSLYAVQVADEQCDHLIKAMLRLYGGELFAGFTIISESQITRVLKWTTIETHKALTRLHDKQLIRYEPASSLPQIAFVMARQEAKRIPLDKEKLAMHRKRATQRLEAIIAYAQQTHRCRMQTIQSYFNEETFDTCGICDVCLRKRKQNYNNTKVNDYKERIRTLLRQTPMNVEVLEKAINPNHRKVFMKTLREMVEATEIEYDEYWVLRNT